ncbi:Methyltransf_7 domain-containing protein [Cephalotus follicularis]|uniref:Methyltransf_7 domain-containing protein n=1 Tax=Cephalotus follicularis TaxID=3775 RepID=A0A1Q3CTG7_CEPFO|nr:Methyltransf_7 domain-containing protein [Cephalotus follicularis]
MNGGEGPYSYANNSCFQRRGTDSAKILLHEEITNKLDLKQICSSSNVFNIVDMGCSVGPNSYIAVQNIIEPIVSNYQSQGLPSLEFHVFFNDHVANDFGTLFKSLPCDKNYFAAAVPGTFYNRLFPKASMHFMHSSYALQWLSMVPNEVEDKNSPSWNKGKILYDSKEVEKVYAAQFDKDMGSFLNARAEEIVCGGFMAILLPSIPTGADPSKCTITAIFHLLGSSLLDFANMGLVDEAEVDSFNLPQYFASPAELEAVIERNGRFKVERIEQWVQPIPQASKSFVEQFASCMRSGNEGITGGHFGSELMDDLFNHYTKKLVDSGLFSDSSYVPLCDMFFFLRRIDENI